MRGGAILWSVAERERERGGRRRGLIRRGENGMGRTLLLLRRRRLQSSLLPLLIRRGIQIAPFRDRLCFGDAACYSFNIFLPIAID